MNKRLRQLLAQRQGKIEAMRSKLNALEAAGQTALDETGQAEYDAMAAEVKSIDAAIEQERALVEAERGALALPDDARIAVGQDRRAQDPTRGFRSMGEFARAVVSASVRPNGAIDERLAIGAAVPTTSSNESTGQDGGYLVPEQFGRDVQTLMLEEDPILPRTDNMPLDGNSIKLPKDETTPWGTNGIRAYWQAELTAATQTKLVLKRDELELHKLIALVPSSNELQADASALDAWLSRAMARSIVWKTDDSFFNGTGAGQPRGFMGHAAMVTVLKESGQAADTVNAQNVTKMFSRMLPSSMRRAIWMVNNDVLPQLFTMTLGSYPIFIPPSGIPEAPAGMLLGRPIVVTQHTQTVGDLGDIVLVDWGMYRTATKRAGIEMASSMHLFFDADAMAFRATFRVDGQPALSAPVSPANGAGTLSAFVALEART